MKIKRSAEGKIKLLLLLLNSFIYFYSTTTNFIIRRQTIHVKLAEQRQQLKELNQRLFVKKLKQIIEKQNKTLNSNEEKREFMTIFDY